MNDIHLLYFMFGLGYAFYSLKYGQNVTSKIMIFVAYLLFFPVFLGSDIAHKLNSDE